MLKAKNKYLRAVLSLSLSGLILLQLSSCIGVVAAGAGAGVLMAQDRRTTGSIVDDQSIELKAKNHIYDLTYGVKNTHVVVVSYNNHLLLAGQVPSAALRQKIEQQIRQIPKVGNVYNEIVIADAISMATRSNDSWITTKIKGDLIANNLNPTHIKVVTEDGIVYLFGIVTKDEEATAVEIARHTQGVEKVVKLFEYLP